MTKKDPDITEERLSTPPPEQHEETGAVTGASENGGEGVPGGTVVKNAHAAGMGALGNSSETIGTDEKTEDDHY